MLEAHCGPMRVHFVFWSEPQPLGGVWWTNRCKVMRLHAHQVFSVRVSLLGTNGLCINSHNSFVNLNI